MKTPQEIGAEIAHWWYLYSRSKADLVNAIDAAIDAERSLARQAVADSVREEREACLQAAKIVLRVAEEGYPVVMVDGTEDQFHWVDRGKVDAAKQIVAAIDARATP